MIELLACKLGRNDEAPNIDLAETLCNNADRLGILEIVAAYKSKETAVADDAIKVLYEIAKRQPQLVADFVADFIAGLAAKNNRIIWGSMMALAYIAPLTSTNIYQHLNEIVMAYRQGSVITIDNSISVFAALCKADSGYCKELLPLLIEHFSSCRPKEIPQHAERLQASLSDHAKKEILNIINSRITELSASQVLRLKKIIRNF